MTKQKCWKIALLLVVTILGIWSFFKFKAILQEYEEFKKQEIEEEDPLDDDYFEDDDEL